MSKAIGMVEYKTVSAGITATDAMVKTSEVSIIEAQRKSSGGQCQRAARFPPDRQFCTRKPA